MKSSTGSKPSFARLPTLEAVLAERSRRAAEKAKREIAQKGELKLANFVRLAWPILEPGSRYVHGWHIDAVCEHLEAITDGELNRLLINVPPGTMKSLLAGVFWPAWEWGPKNRPSTRILGSSYSEAYAVRDNTRMRNLVQSDWYQELWGHRVRLTKAGERKFENTAKGWREGVPFSRMTGGRGDRVIIDDPHSTEGAESDAERERALRIFRESVPTRLNDPVRSAIIVIMQRLHERDVSGVIVSQDLGYEHLMLPMEFEPSRRCQTSIGFKDPRSYEGELLFPERFPREAVERDKKAMGSYAVAGQFQQRPSPRDGGLFKRSWFGVVGAAPVNCRWVRAWDLAASEAKQGSAPAYTAGLKMGRSPDGRYFIADVRRERLSPGGVERLIVNTARQDGRLVRISLPQDPGQAGKAQAQYLIKQLAGFIVKATPESGDKVTRAEPVAAQAEAGNVYLVEGPWNEAFLDEVSNFPSGAFKDQTDALSRAFTELMLTQPSVVEML